MLPNLDVFLSCLSRRVLSKMNEDFVPPCGLAMFCNSTLETCFLFSGFGRQGRDRSSPIRWQSNPEV